MNNFDKLNQLIEYIEQNLNHEIDSKKLAQILCVNEYTMHRIFQFIANISLSEYIRNRKLSMAAIELLNSNTKVIDLAMKYGYDSPISFSRAFYKFHGIKPSQVKKKQTYLKNFPPLHFSSTVSNEMKLDFKIIDKPDLTLYSISKEILVPDIKLFAPKFWKDTENDLKYKEIFNYITYGIIEYDNYFPTPKTARYHIASASCFNNATPIHIPKSTWAVFHVNDISGEAMAKLSLYVYQNWIPYSGYNIRNIPELEVYYKDHTEWCLPIEKIF